MFIQYFQGAANSKDYKEHKNSVFKKLTIQ